MRRATTFLLLTLFAAATATAAWAQETKRIQETLPIDPNGSVSIDTYKGSITVTTWDRNEVQIEAVVEADDDEELVALTEVRIDGNGRRVRIDTDYEKAQDERKGWFGGGSMSLPFVHYTIQMPRTAELTIDDYKSDISLAGLSSGVEVETYKGQVEADKVAGLFDLETYKGTARVRGLDGGLRVDTYKGDIQVEFDRLAGDVSLDTYRGTIELVLPEDAGFDLDADMGRRGDLESTFDLASLRDSDEDDDDQRYRGPVAGGGPRLEAETYRGTIRVVSRGS